MTPASPTRWQATPSPSLSSEELVQYVTGTPLFKAMMDELEARGVNTENIMELYTKDAAFSA